MKHSLHRFASLIVAACIAAASFVIDCALSVYRFGRDLGIATLTGPVQMRQAAEVIQRVGFVIAATFTGRIVKRERPVLTADWRMCPSI
jgi:hypothetical protein